MTIENCIEDLKRRAKFAAEKADTAQKTSKAQNYVNVVNSVIDYYNYAEQYIEQYTNLRSILLIMLESSGVSEFDCSRMISIDPLFFRYHLINAIYRILKTKEENPDYRISEKRLFHNIAECWDQLQFEIKNLAKLRELRSTCNNQEIIALYDQCINDSEAFIEELTNFADLEKKEMYIELW